MPREGRRWENAMFYYVSVAPVIKVFEMVVERCLVGENLVRPCWVGAPKQIDPIFQFRRPLKWGMGSKF